MITDILLEFEAMSVRLGELTRMLREEVIRQQREGGAESEAVILTEETIPRRGKATPAKDAGPTGKRRM